MMDNLEKFVQAHRDAFDDKNPDPMLWSRIEHLLPASGREVRRVFLWKYVAVAAVGLVLILSGVVAGLFMGRGSTMQDPAYAEFLQTQQYYQSEFNKKKSELSQYVYDPEVDDDLRELDRMYNELSSELKTTAKPNKTELINAMIQIYQAKIDLLERVMRRVDESKSEMPKTYDDDDTIKI